MYIKTNPTPPTVTPKKQFTTPKRGYEKMQLENSKNNMQKTYTIECTGDICVGDTILISERLFERPTNALKLAMGAKGYQTSVANGVIRDNDKGTVRLNTNSTASESQFGDHCTITEEGAFIGERTIAAYVSKDNYRSTKNIVNSASMSNETRGKFWALWEQGKHKDSVYIIPNPSHTARK